jgi:hypothetical protein
VAPRPGAPEGDTAGDSRGSGGARTATTHRLPLPEDPFALFPLVRRALTARAGDAFASLPDDLLHDILTVALRAAEQGPLDDATAEDLVEIARRIATHRRDAVQPLLAALLRCRANAARPQDAVPVLEAARGDLPLDDETWRTVRSEFGPPPEDELRALLRRPPSPAWEKPSAAIALGGPRCRGGRRGRSGRSSCSAASRRRPSTSSLTSFVARV